MITVIYSHKPGQGVTTIAAALATMTAHAGRRTLLVDTSTDLAAVLGIREPDRPGLGDYLNDTTITLGDIAEDVAPNLDLIGRGDDTAPTFTASTYGLLTSGLGHYDNVIIDTAPDAHEWTRHAAATVLVTRPCYLALRHATGRRRPDHLVIINEPGRTLTPADIEAAVGTRVTATVPYLPDIARAVDAGTMTARTPRSLARALAPLVNTMMNLSVTR